MPTLEDHIKGLQRLETEGFCVTSFEAKVVIARGDEIVEFALSEYDAGVVAANRNRYHVGDDPHEAYHKHAEANAKAKEKGKKLEDSANELVKLLDAIAKRAFSVYAKEGTSPPSWREGEDGKWVDYKGFTRWLVVPGLAKNHYNDIEVLRHPTTNKFKFASASPYVFQKAGMPNSSKNWVSPATFLNKLGTHPEILKMIADPTLMEGV